MMGPEVLATLVLFRRFHFYVYDDSLYSDPRPRSLSESITSSTSRSAHSTRPVAKSKAHVAPSDSANTADTSKSGPSSSYDTVGSPGSAGMFSPSQDVIVEDNSHQNSLEASRQTTPPLPKVKVGSAKVARDGADEEEGEFARHVRGTSTPIDISPPATPTDRSHTFDSNYDRSNLEHPSAPDPSLPVPSDKLVVAGLEPDGGGKGVAGGMSEEGSLKRGTLQRGEAMDTPENHTSNGTEEVSSSM